MAMAVRTASAWRVSSMARVRCGVETARKPQQVLLHTEKTSSVSNLPIKRASSLSISYAVEHAALRCQAAKATATAVRETSADRVEEAESMSMEDTRAALRDNFEAASVSGRAECGSNQECRLILEVSEFLSVGAAETAADVAGAHHHSRVYHGRRGGGDAYPGLTTIKSTLIPVSALDRSEMVTSFEAALQDPGRNSELLSDLARVAWRNLGDADRAEELYKEALHLSPEDSNIQASYAQFLWQCDV